MKLAHHHRGRGDEVHFSRSVYRDMFEPDYDTVYGSAIFSYSAARVERFKRGFPGAVVSGTWDMASHVTVEQHLGIDEAETCDYSLYPDFDASIGFSQRGCRLKCGFCVVPRKEGKPRSVNTIPSLWRGEPYPKHLHLLDNDFFGQPREQWEARIDEMRQGGFKVCLNQGINVRMIDETSAAALATLDVTDDQFKTRRLYTAWDNIGDEQRFFTGVDTLERHGIPPNALMVYMLIGYDRRETWERVMYRFEKMVTRGIQPYPMVYGERNRRLPLGDADARLARRSLGEFQRWVIRRIYQFVPFVQYDLRAETHRPPGLELGRAGDADEQERL